MPPPAGRSVSSGPQANHLIHCPFPASLLTVLFSPRLMPQVRRARLLKDGERIMVEVAQKTPLEQVINLSGPLTMYGSSISS